MIDVVNGGSGTAHQASLENVKSPVKRAPRNGDQNTKSAPRRGSLDFCRLTNRDTRSQSFTKAMLARPCTAVHMPRR
jgi:hypothetical protein